MHKLLLTSILLLAACTHEDGTNVTPAQLSQFQKGVTTEQQVEAALGRPVNVVTSDDGTRTVVYSHAVTDVSGGAVIPGVGTMHDSGSTTSRDVVFQFGPDGILKDMTGMDSTVAR